MALRANIGRKSAISLQQGPVDPKFQVEGVAPHQPFFFLENQAKWSFVWYKNLDRSFFRFVTIHAFDRQTDRQADGQTDGQTGRRTEFSLLYGACIPCSEVKITFLSFDSNNKSLKSTPVHSAHKYLGFIFTAVHWTQNGLHRVSKKQNGRFPQKIALRFKKVCYKVSLCENCQRQSCKAFIGLTNRAKMIGGGRTLVPEIWD